MSREDYELGWVAGARAMRADVVHALRAVTDNEEAEALGDLVASLPLPLPREPEAP